MSTKTTHSCDVCDDEIDVALPGSVRVTIVERPESKNNTREVELCRKHAGSLYKACLKPGYVVTAERTGP